MEEQPPSGLTCPLTLCMYRNPVVLETGQVYEKDAIDEWLQNNSTDPQTNTELRLPELRIPAVLQRQQVQEWLEAHPTVIPDGWASRDLPAAQTPVVPTPNVQSDAEDIQDMENDLKCSLTREFMRDPVMLLDTNDETIGGHTYERQEIANYVKQRRMNHVPVVDPNSNVWIKRPQLAINWCVRKLMQRFLDDHPDFKPESWPDRNIPPSLLHTDIMDCIRRIDHDSLMALIAEGEDVNASHEYGNTAIGQTMYCFANCTSMPDIVGLRKIFDSLIDRNADVTVSFRDSRTNGPQKSLVRLCIKKRVLANEPDEENRRQLQEHMLRRLIEKNAPVSDAASPDLRDLPYSESPLPYTVDAGYIHLSKVLFYECGHKLSMGEVGESLLSLVDSRMEHFDFVKDMVDKLLSTRWIVLEDPAVSYYFSIIIESVAKLNLDWTKYLLQKYVEHEKQKEGDRHRGFHLDNCIGRAVYVLSGTELRRGEKELRRPTYKIMQLLLKYVTGSVVQVLAETYDNEEYFDNFNSTLYRSIRTGRLSLAAMLVDKVEDFEDNEACILKLIERVSSEDSFEENEDLLRRLLKRFKWEDERDMSNPDERRDTLFTKSLKVENVKVECIDAMITAAIEAGKPEYLSISDGVDMSPLELCGEPSIAERLISLMDTEISLDVLVSTIDKRKPNGLGILKHMLSFNESRWATKDDERFSLSELFLAALNKKDVAMASFVNDKGTVILDMSQFIKMLVAVMELIRFHDGESDGESVEFKPMNEFWPFYHMIDKVAKAAIKNFESEEILVTRRHLRSVAGPDPTGIDPEQQKHGYHDGWEGNLLHYLCRHPFFFRSPEAPETALSCEWIKLILSKLAEVGRVTEAVKSRCKMSLQPGNPMHKLTALQVACTEGCNVVSELLNAGADLIPPRSHYDLLPLNLAFKHVFNHGIATQYSTTNVRELIEAELKNGLVPFQLENDMTDFLTGFWRESDESDSFLTRALNLHVVDFALIHDDPWPLPKDYLQFGDPPKPPGEMPIRQFNDDINLFDMVMEYFGTCDDLKSCVARNSGYWKRNIGEAFAICARFDSDIGIRLAKDIFRIFGTDNCNFAKGFHEIIQRNNTKMFDFILSTIDFKRDDLFADLDFNYSPIEDCLSRMIECHELQKLKVSEDREDREGPDLGNLGNSYLSVIHTELKHMLTSMTNLTDKIPTDVVHMACSSPVTMQECGVWELLTEHPGFDVNAMPDPVPGAWAGSTVLFNAVEPENGNAMASKRNSTIKTILSLGGDPNVRCHREGNTPLHLAVEISKVNDMLITQLFKYSKVPIQIDVKNRMGNTLLHVAENVKVAQVLIDKGASPHRKNTFGQTPAEFWNGIIDHIEREKAAKRNRQTPPTCEESDRRRTIFERAGFAVDSFTAPRLKRIQATLEFLLEKESEIKSDNGSSETEEKDTRETANTNARGKRKHAVLLDPMDFVSLLDDDEDDSTVGGGVGRGEGSTSRKKRKTGNQDGARKQKQAGSKGKRAAGGHG